MKEGKSPMTDEELKEKLDNERDKKSKLDIAQAKLEEAQKKKSESVQSLIETALRAQRECTDKLNAGIEESKMRHYLTMGGLGVVWVAFIIYSNFF